MKRICTCLLAAALVVGAFTGCAAKPAAGTDTTTKQETTTETTTVTTTENTKTTFRESYTSTIYPALHRKGGSGYSHELASYTTYYDAKNETRTANITALQHAEGISKMDFFIPPHFIATPVTHQQSALQHAEGISKARKN